MRVLARGTLAWVLLCHKTGVRVGMGEQGSFGVDSTPEALAEWWETNVEVEVVDYEIDGAAVLFVRPAE